jgi:hypothetical protein
LVSWRDSVSGAAYLNAVTTYEQYCTSTATARPGPARSRPTRYTEAWKVKGTWQFVMPAPVAAITADMDDAAIAVQQKRIADAILALGGGGSQQEQPICTLLRYIGQDASALPKHAVFVVLTDEDDTSPPDVCVAGYEAYQQVNAFPSEVLCDSNCTEYVYMAYKPNQELDLNFTCMPVDDKGTSHPERATQKSLVAQSTAQCAGDAGRRRRSPAPTGSSPRRASSAARALSCKTVRTPASSARAVLECDLTRPDNKTDICTQPFDQNGVHYANLADYCSRSRSNGTGWQTCEVRGPQDHHCGRRHLRLLRGTHDPARLRKEHGGHDPVIQEQRRPASSETVTIRSRRSCFDPAFSCPLNPGQSYATNLRSLASSASDVFPLCQDYAPAIERIASFADYLIQTTFPLTSTSTRTSTRSS